MRRVKMMGMCMLAVGFLMLGGCSSSDLKEENALLMEENQNLRTQLMERNEALDASHNQLRDKAREMAEMTRRVDDVNRQRAQPITGFEDIAGVTSSVGAGEVTAIVEGDVLFTSGKSSLRKTAKSSLAQIARVLNSTYAGRTIRVEGHTDRDPIRKSGFKSNDHLGFERAFSVKEFLISKGVNTKRFAVTSFGPNKPLGSKTKSRRVEVVVVLD